MEKIQHMLINKDAILEVARHSDEIDEGASSHWRLNNQNTGEHPLKNDPFDFIYGSRGFSAIGPIGAISTKTGLAHRVAHRLLQLPSRYLGRKFKEFRHIDRAAASIARRQNRVYDKDLLRHTLTLATLRDQLDLESEADPIAVIGDGFGNMTALILASLPKSRVILVNLTKTLLVDLAFIHKAFPNTGIALIRDAEEMTEALARTDIRVMAIRADNAQLLAGTPIALAINILSMMEMNPPVTKMYFDVLRQCPRASTAFYCCNRIEKRLPDGTITRFFDYPWDRDDEILIDEPTPWDKFAYRGAPPFYYKGSTTHHRLVHLKKIS